MEFKNKTIEELLKTAKENSKKLGIPPKKFKHTEDGTIILDPNKEFDREWYGNDKDYDILN
jgi:hypothetical protein